MTDQPHVEEVDWDGQSPIHGEPVTSDVMIAWKRYVFTQHAMYIVKPKHETESAGR